MFFLGGGGLKQWVGFCKNKKKVPVRYDTSTVETPLLDVSGYVSLAKFNYTNLQLLRVISPNNRLLGGLRSVLKLLSRN